MAMELLLARYEKSLKAGGGPELLSGTPGVAVSAGFRSQAELVAAMRDKRYNVDPAYRADVEKRLAISTNIKF